MLATLPNLLMHRDAPGDAERAYVMCAALMSDFPPAMRERRHQITYDYVQALVRTKQFAKAFETCDAINPPTARDAAEARELRFESLANLRGCLERKNTYHATQDPSNLELAVAVSRELLKLRDGAAELVVDATRVVDIAYEDRGVLGLTVVVSGRGGAFMLATLDGDDGGARERFFSLAE